MSAQKRDRQRWSDDPDRTFCDTCDKEYMLVKNYRTHMYKYHRDRIGMEQPKKRTIGGNMRDPATGRFLSAEERAAARRVGRPPKPRPANAPSPRVVTDPEPSRARSADRGRRPNSGREAEESEESESSGAERMSAPERPQAPPRATTLQALQERAGREADLIGRLNYVLDLDEARRVFLEHEDLAQMSSSVLNARMQACVAFERDFVGARATIDGARHDVAAALDGVEERLQNSAWNNRANMGLYALELELRRAPPPVRPAEPRGAHDASGPQPSAPGPQPSASGPKPSHAEPRPAVPQ